MTKMDRALRVLIVEDNSDTAMSLKDVINDAGDVADICLQGGEAVAKAVSLRPDVILLDLSLPGMDGVDIARALRADPRLPNLKIIAVTGASGPEARQRTAAAGFDLHLAKPVRSELLADMLDLLRTTPQHIN